MIKKVYSASDGASCSGNEDTAIQQSRDASHQLYFGQRVLHSTLKTQTKFVNVDVLEGPYEERGLGPLHIGAARRQIYRGVTVSMRKGHPCLPLLRLRAVRRPWPESGKHLVCFRHEIAAESERKLGERSTCCAQHRGQLQVGRGLAPQDALDQCHATITGDQAQYIAK